MESLAARSAEGDDRCPECGGSHLVWDYFRGELVCETCGLVLRDNYVEKAPGGSPNGDQGHTGAPMTFTSHDKGLTTEISPASRDFGGRPLDPADRVKYHRMRRLQRRMRYSRLGERTLAEALVELDRQATLLGLPEDFREEAALTYRRAASQGLVRGRTIPGMVAAVLYIACRRRSVPRTLGEVARVSGVDQRDLSLSYKALIRGLHLGIPTPRAEDYLERFANTLGVSKGIQTRALRILRGVEEREVHSSRAPMGTAAAAIYLAGLLEGQRIPQERIGQVAGVSEVTIRVRYTAIAKELGLVVKAPLR